jgi:hypothetical protein
MAERKGLTRGQEPCPGPVGTVTALPGLVREHAPARHRGGWTLL